MNDVGGRPDMNARSSGRRLIHPAWLEERKFLAFVEELAEIKAAHPEVHW